MKDGILRGLPVDLIMACYAAAPGNEIESGKFASPESSAALAANTFGLFLADQMQMPPMPGAEAWGPGILVTLEATLRFPWRGGHHPCLDALIETGSALIGIESKRYEPFRPKADVGFSDAYWRPVWGSDMGGYQHVRDGIRDASLNFVHLDAAQLVKHAFGLRTSIHRAGVWKGKQPVLFYLYAEPKRWPDGRPIPGEHVERHRAEIAEFAKLVSADEVQFRSCSYHTLLSSWAASDIDQLRAHATAIARHFSP